MAASNYIAMSSSLTETMLETIKCIGLIFFNATKLLFKKCGFTLVPQDELNFNMGEKNRLIGSSTNMKTLHKLVLTLTIHIFSMCIVY